jgi:hypothetical protein
MTSPQPVAADDRSAQWAFLLESDTRLAWTRGSGVPGMPLNRLRCTDGSPTTLLSEKKSLPRPDEFLERDGL